jgi:DNA-binding response OmpR family regulator
MRSGSGLVEDAAPQTTECEAQTGGPGRVLVIEDDEHLREVMEALITIEGCEARTASNGNEALKVVEAWQPDLILLDLYMPGMDGREFLTAYRALEGAHAPVILLTGRTQTDEDVAHLGVAGQLPKPFNVNELLDMVSQFTDCSHGGES